jgi:LCP family protein required for cell wall assembly
MVIMVKRRVYRQVLWGLLVVIGLGLGVGAAAASGMAPEASGDAQQGTPSPTPTLPIGTYAPPVEAPVTAVPAVVTPVESPDGDDVFNVLLLGSDTANAANSGRTDAIMIVSLNRTQGTANLLSIPRDLFVYIPGWTMQRINAAFGYGQRNDYPGGGYGLLKDTIQYNLGIRIDRYARVDFNDFQYIIDALGGVEITVDCAIQDWQLIEPDMDPQVEDNWELVTLPVGIHELNGYEALWYSRSRRTSSDFDRGRRQQVVMQAIWRRLHELGLLNQIPALWGQVTETVENDMSLPDLLGLVPMALSIDSAHIAHFLFQSGVHVRSWRTPAGNSVLLPETDAVQGLVQHFMLPPTVNQLVQGGAVIEVLNATGYAGLDRVAAERLSWEGFAAYAGGVDEAVRYQASTVIYDFTGRTKGGAVGALLAVLSLQPEAVIVAPDAERTVDYRIVLGGNYRSCTYGVMPPVATPAPVEEAAAGS